MLNMLDDDKKKMATLILGSGSSEKSEKSEKGSGDSYADKVASSLIASIKEGNPQDVVKYFKEMISCCDHGDSYDDSDS